MKLKYNLFRKYNDNLLIIGSKKYNNLEINDIIDNFICFRCNLAVPNGKNGNKCNGFFLNNHLYENLINKNVNKETFLNYYKIKSKDDKDRFITVYNKFNEIKNKLDFIITNHRFNLILNNSNSFLNHIGCKIRFKKILSIGYSGILISLMNNFNNNKIFVFGFSINKLRMSFYYNDEKKPRGCHDFENELEILKWLHNNKYIDITLCLLEDSNEKIINCQELNPNPDILKKLINIYGSVTLINYNNQTIYILENEKINYLKINNDKIILN